MSADLPELCAPDRVALVTQECQVGVVGADAIFDELAETAATTVVPNGVRLLAAARAAGVPVVHCLALRRDDGNGSNMNARMFAAVRKSGVSLAPGSLTAALVPEFGPEPSDIVLSRLHGLGPMGGTDLDPVLRNLGVSTIVGIGVSLNVGMVNFAFDAVNAGYQFVLPADATAGVPREYGDAVLANTMSLVATVTTTNAVVRTWEAAA